MQESSRRSWSSSPANWLLPALVLVGLTGPRISAAAPTGDEGSSEAGAVDARALLEAVDEVGDAVDRWEQTARDREATSPDAVLERLEGRPGPERLFEWVRDEVEYEPYRGAIRGPEQALSLRAANAVDQARLLAALYDRAGVSYRYVFGSLSEVEAIEVLGTFAGRLRGAGDVQTDAGEALVSREPAHVDDEYVSLVDSHTWLEVERSDGSFVSADPVASSTLGATSGEAERRSDHLPEERRSSLQMRLAATLQGGHEKVLLTVETDVERASHRPFHFTVEPSSVEGALLPRIEVDGRSETGERFAPSKLRRLSVEYDVSTWVHRRHFERELYDASSAQGGFRAERTVFTTLLVPGWTDPAVAARVAAEQVGTDLASLRPRLVEATEQGTGLDETTVESALEAVGTMNGFARLLHEDALTDRLATSTGVRPVQLAPRIVYSVASADRGVGVEVETRGERLHALPKRGISTSATRAFQTLRGYAVDRLGSEMMADVTDRRVLSVREVFERARSSGVSLTTVQGGDIGGVEAVEVSPRVDSALRRDVRGRGRVALAPVRAVEVAGERRYAWWSVDPTTGAVRGRHPSERVGFYEAPDGEARAGVAVDRALVRSGELLASGLGGERNYEEAACRGLREARFTGRALCASGEPESLPSLDTCRSEGSSSSGDGEIGVVGLQVDSCGSTAREARCGARAAGGLLSDETALVEGTASSTLPGRAGTSDGGLIECGGS